MFDYVYILVILFGNFPYDTFIDKDRYTGYVMRLTTFTISDLFMKIALFLVFAT